MRHWAKLQGRPHRSCVDGAPLALLSSAAAPRGRLANICPVHVLRMHACMYIPWALCTECTEHTQQQSIAPALRGQRRSASSRGRPTAFCWLPRRCPNSRRMHGVIHEVPTYVHYMHGVLTRTSTPRPTWQVPSVRTQEKARPIAAASPPALAATGLVQERILSETRHRVSATSNWARGALAIHEVRRRPARSIINDVFVFSEPQQRRLAWALRPNERPAPATSPVSPASPPLVSCGRRSRCRCSRGAAWQPRHATAAVAGQLFRMAQSRSIANLPGRGPVVWVASLPPISSAVEEQTRHGDPAGDADRLCARTRKTCCSQAACNRHTYV